MKKALPTRLPTGVTGLDEILGGGLIPARAYLLRGGPGTGKTTVGLHFLTSGDPHVEKPLFITMGEPEAQIRKNAEAVGFDLEGVTFLDLSPSSAFFSEVQSYDIFAPAEVEREPMTQQIIAQVDMLKPKRVFLDAMTQFRYWPPMPSSSASKRCLFYAFSSNRGQRCSSPLRAVMRLPMTICNSWPMASSTWILRLRGAPSASASFGAPTSAVACTR